MKLYFVRHGDAVSLAATDSARPLSELGREEVRQVGTLLKAMDARPDAIFASPRERAQQTAAILSELLGVGVITDDAVNYEFNVRLLNGLLQQKPQASQLMFVGHNPSMSHMVRATSGARVGLKTAAVARVSVLDDVQSGSLDWLITPRVARSQMG